MCRLGAAKGGEIKNKKNCHERERERERQPERSGEGRSQAQAERPLKEGVCVRRKKCDGRETWRLQGKRLQVELEYGL